MDSAQTAAKPRRSRGTGRVRIEDVARAAEVSAQTVSRYLRQPGSVSEPMAVRIAQAIAGVGYVPNLIAGSLASNRSRIVAILVPTLANPVHSGPVEGLGEALRDEGYQVLVGTTDYRVELEDALIRAFAGRRVDGLVVTSGRISPASQAVLKAAAIPVVQLWELPRRPFDMAVGISNRAIGEAVARHFAERGYDRLAVIGHVEAADTRSSARVDGFLAEAGRLGLPAPFRKDIARPMLVHDATPLLAELRTAGVRAVFSTSAQLAVVMLLNAVAQGIAVPGELAIMGLHSPLAAVVRPTLSTVEVPATRFGLLAGRMLLRRMAGEPVEARVVDTGFTVSVRQSS